MPKRAKKAHPSRQGQIETMAVPKQLRGPLQTRLDAIVLNEIKRLTSQFLLLGKTDSELLSKAVEVFESEVAAAMWLVSPQRFSNRSTPIELAATAIGRQQVIEELGRIEYGVFS